jgi:streptogramin lyase
MPRLVRRDGPRVQSVVPVHDRGWAVSGSRIFISYRHADSAGYAGRLHDRLQQRYGDQHVFMDLEMEYGIDFVERIGDAVGTSAVMLVMIGPGWLDARDEGNARRLDDPDDFVRIEVSSALARPTRVIPVLVGNAKMPERGDLPEPMQALARRNALELSDSRWEFDVGRLVQTVDGVINARADQAASRPRADVATPASTAVPRDADEANSAATRPGSQHAGPERRRRKIVLTAAVAVVVVAIAVAVVALGSDGNGKGGGGDKTPALKTVALGSSAEPRAVAVDQARSTLWVAERRPGKLAEISLPDLKLKNTIQLPAGAKPSRIIVGEGGILWLSDPPKHRLIRVDPGDGEPTLRSVPGRPRGIAEDRAGHRIFIADETKQQVIAEPAAGGAQQPWPVDVFPRSLALGEPGVVWVTDPGGQKVVRLDTKTGVPEVVREGGTPVEVARDAATGRIWVTDSASDQVIRIGRDNDQEPFAKDPFSVGHQPGNLAIADGIVWVVNVGAGSVTRLFHRSPHRRADIHVGGELAGIAASGTKAWVADAGSGKVTEISSP